MDWPPVSAVPQFYSIPVCVVLDCHGEFSLVKRCLFNTRSKLKLPEFNTKNALRLDLPEKFTMFFFGGVGWLNGLGPVVFFWQALEIPVRELLQWWTPPGCSSLGKTGLGSQG